MSPIATARHGQAVITYPSHDHESKPLLPPASSPVGELSSSLPSSSSPFFPPFSGSKSSTRRVVGCGGTSGRHSTTTATTAASSSSSSSNIRSSAYGASPTLPPCNSPSSPSPRFRDWLRPTKATATTSALLDVWIPWLAYLGLGVGANDFILGGLAAAGVAMLGFLFQGYRFHGQRSLRTWPKAHGVGVLLTWVANAVFVAGLASDGDIATRYSLLVVISGVVLSNIVSLALGHPALLDEAREHVSSEEEESHHLFVRMHTITSSMLFLLSLLQWLCFFLAAVVYPDDEVGSLLVVLALVSLYLRKQQKQLARALRPPLLWVDEEEGGREGGKEDNQLTPTSPLLTSL